MGHLFCLLKVLSAALVLVAFPRWSGATPMLQVVNGELTGATEVSVNGVLYNVQFVDGTCIELFTGCDQPGDFTFTTQADALAATAALFAQVFVDGADGEFDANPELTSGCTSLSQCWAMTPFANPASGSVIAGVALNSNGFDPAPFPAVMSADFDSVIPFANLDTRVFVQWTPVPEPATLVCVAMGVLALAAASGGRRGRAGSTEQPSATPRLARRE
jgi:hypothetical protein